MHEEQDDSRLPWTWLAALSVAFFLLHAALAPRVMGEGDSAEFTLALALTGVPHPPGYPLYTLAGSVFVHALRGMGFGWAHAANLWSAAGAGIALLLTAALADRMIPSALRLGRAPRALVIASALTAMAVNPVFMRAATQAEVYSWEAAWTALSALAALALLRRIEVRTSATARGEVPASFAWGVLMGVVLAHRPTMAATAVPLTLVLVAAMVRHARLRTAIVLASMAGFCLPMSAQWFIAWRAEHPAAFQWPMLEPTVQSVLAHASATYYRAYLGGGGSRGDGGGPFFSALLPVFLLAALSAVIVAPQLRGSRAGKVLLALLGGASLQCVFVAVYRVSDFAYFLLPLLVPAVVLLACGAAVLVSRASAPMPPAAALFVVAASCGAFAVRGEFTHVRAIAQTDEDVRAAFVALPFERGIVVWNSDSYTRLVGYQLLEGRKPGIVVLNGSVLTWPPARRAATQRLGFDPLAGLTLRTDADLASVARHIASRTAWPVADFGVWWESGGAASR